MPVLPEPSPTPGDNPTISVCAAWATLEDACAPCTADTDGLLKWVGVASDLLYELSGQRFPGVCEDVARPCAQPCGGDGPRFYGNPVDLWSNGSVSMLGSCGCGHHQTCGCNTLSSLTLTGWPLLEVSEVTIDGDTVDPAAYEINDWSRLVRTDGDAWPACSDDFAVTFLYGAAPPSAGVQAAAELGCQLALACAGSSDCRLPQRVQSITRQGVSMVLLDPFTFFDEGRTGLYLTDLFLAAYGPTAKKRWPAIIANVDQRRAVRRVTG